MIKSVAPEDLLPHRVFFTEFDRYSNSKLWTRANEADSIDRLIRRKIKLLLLTKGNIVVAASQLLESPFAHSLILENPALLEKGAIVSSMKFGHSTSVEFLETKREEYKTKPNSAYHSGSASELASLLDASAQIVRWRINDMSDWFRDRLVKDLIDQKSLLTLTLRSQQTVAPIDLAKEIRQQPVLSRDAVDSIVSKYKNASLRSIVVAYADFLYYLSGARTTGSEGVLPQENLVDFSISDMIGGRTKLSEFEVFLKVFIDTVKARTSTIFPVDFLDTIPISEAIELREIAIEKSFTDKYNLIQIKTKQILQINDPEKLVLLMHELEMFETELYNEFSSALDKELPTRIRESKKRSIAKIINAIASIVIPGYALDSAREIVISGLELLGKKDAAKKLNGKIDSGIKACETALENINILDRQVLLDFVDEMKKRYQKKML